MIINENADYYDGPEGRLGLKQVASIEMSWPCYSFDTLACWWDLPEWEDQSYLPRFVDDKTSAAKAVAEFNTDGDSDDS